jgi:2'-5' RNA ligase
LNLFAIAVPFPGLAAVVDDWRERTCDAKPSHGVPPHVTLLVPGPSDVEGIQKALAPFTGFDVGFARFGRFPGVLWLAPAPAEPFSAMTDALLRAFPDHLPYAGTVSDPQPHLTVAQDELDEAEADLLPWLPLQSRVESVVLFERAAPDHWHEVATFDLEED